MARRDRGSVGLGLALVLLLPATAIAQATQQFDPQFALPGKDVVWVPTPAAMVEVMLDLARVTPQDVVVDLGSGDGRMVISAARRGARARGVEYNPEMVRLSKRRAIEAGVQDRVTFVEGDMFEADIADATVMVVFLLAETMQRLQPRILALRPGTRIVSNTFGFPEWPADDRVTRPDCDAWCTAQSWVVPAQVGGDWQVKGGPTLRLDQHFQKVTGLIVGPAGSTIQGGTVSGPELAFAVGDASVVARLDGDRLVGTRTEARRASVWVATRIAR
ncbi:arsenite S-adenosylmethyltransferase [Luteitalea pratensis]|uniref:Arsenite S-adenosylmethyltransferase n=1 Tax=Luteitalea pratensis TaxID=1855912 RepID=A0A143PKJ3_LUTPR|nr:class I SAM-dependent methyltransferase [Luteitalea pratensis]AMY08279.1 arsenite S-adenosylmethyltransferase [Luteitalea pratensis]